VLSLSIKRVLVRVENVVGALFLALPMRRCIGLEHRLQVFAAVSAVSVEKEGCRVAPKRESCN
jgi:hypothetical protein